jgi:hypothetical protein
MVTESGKLSKSGLGIGGNGCFGAAISKPLMAEIGRLNPVPDTTASTDSSRPGAAAFRDEAPATEHDKDENNDVHPKHM